MIQNKLITLTGGDCTGKATQTKILARLVEHQYGKCTTFESPDYNNPIGKLLGAMLDDMPFKLGTEEVTSKYNKEKKKWDLFQHPPLRNGNFYGKMPAMRENPLVYHALLTANYYQVQPAIKAALDEGHVICDRYGDVEDLVFCPVTCREFFINNVIGSELDYMLKVNPDDTHYYDMKLDRMIQEWVIKSRAGIRRSDYVVVLDSIGYPRENEIPDINERDTLLQQTVRNRYLKTAEELEWIVIPCDVINAETEAGPEYLGNRISHITFEICSELSQAGFDITYNHEIVKQVLDELNIKYSTK